MFYNYRLVFGTVTKFQINCCIVIKKVLKKSKPLGWYPVKSNKVKTYTLQEI